MRKTSVCQKWRKTLSRQHENSALHPQEIALDPSLKGLLKSIAITQRWKFTILWNKPARTTWLSFTFPPTRRLYKPLRLFFLIQVTSLTYITFMIFIIFVIPVNHVSKVKCLWLSSAWWRVCGHDFFITCPSPSIMRHFKCATLNS